MAIRNPYERFGRITKTSGSRYICFGELIERVRENDRLSPSAEKVLPHFNDNAREILGTREDGQPNWDECQDNEKYQAIQFLELQEIYDPLLVESLKFNDDEFMSRFQNRNPFMTRDEDGEIRATDEGVRICTEEFLKGLDTREADLKNPPRSVQPDSWPFYLFGTLIAKGGSIYHPRATSILSQGQREIVGDAIRKAYSTFAPYFEQAPEGETKAYFSPFFEAYVDQFVLQRELERSPKSNRPVIDLRYLSTLQESSGGQPIASSPFVVYAFNPMFEKSSWKESSKGEQFYPVLDEENKHLTYLIARKDMDGVETVRGDEAKAILKTLGLDTALLHAQFANYCYRTTRDGSRDISAYATADQLIKFLSLNEKKKRDPKTGKRTRLSREEQIQELKEYLHSLRALHIQFEGTVRDGRTWRTERPEPLWIISLLETSQILMGTDIKDMTVTMDFVAQVMPGPWSQMEKGRNKHLLYRHIPKEILEFDHQKERWGACWVFWTSCRIGIAGYNKFTIKALLEIVLSTEEIQFLGDPANRKERYNAVSKLENNLKAMESHGWRIKRSREYSRAMGTDGDRRSRNFFQDLLDSTVEITPPRSSETLEQIFPQKGQSDPPLLPEGARNHLTGASFKKQRKSIGFSQRDAGREIGKSQSFISLVEKGERNLSDEDIKKWESVKDKYHQILRTEGD